jgi:hypothetical protein
MKKYLFYIVASAMQLSPLFLCLSRGAEVASPQARTNTLELAERLINPAVKEASAVTVNPFTLNGSRSVEATADESQAAAALAAIMASNRSLLVALADQLDPKGTFVVGGESIILLGQKKLKVGETYPITFEGAVYELEITAIETTRFSVRYKNEELTRPIVITKSAR